MQSTTRTFRKRERHRPIDLRNFFFCAIMATVANAEAAATAAAVATSLSNHYTIATVWARITFSKGSGQTSKARRQTPTPKGCTSYSNRKHRTAQCASCLASYPTKFSNIVDALRIGYCCPRCIIKFATQWQKKYQ